VYYNLYFSAPNHRALRINYLNAPATFVGRYPPFHSESQRSLQHLRSLSLLIVYSYYVQHLCPLLCGSYGRDRSLTKRRKTTAQQVV
jgi:hypothetical protein